jgi:outer membrane protein assembly factor BamB
MRWAEPDVHTPRLCRAAIAGVAIVALGACSLFGPTRTPPDPLPAPSNAVKIQPAWNTSLGARSGIGFAPVAIGDSVWAAAQDGTVTRISLDTGRPFWRVSVGKPLTAGVGTDGATTVVATRDGTVVALDELGRIRWTAPVNGEVVTAPAVADGVVLVRTTDNRMLAFEVDGGKRRWSFQRQNPPLVLRNSGGVAMIPGAAFIGMPSGRVVALALQNGAPRWDVPLSQPRGTTELERIADVVGSPLIIGRELCAATYQGRIGCLDLASGSPAWLRDFSSAVGLDVDSRGVVAPDADDVVNAFDRTGAPSWQVKAFQRRRLSAPLIVGSVIALGDFEGNLLWLSRAEGSLAAVSRTDGKPIVAPPAAVGSTLVVQTSGGGLYAFRTP